MLKSLWKTSVVIIFAFAAVPLEAYEFESTGYNLKIRAFQTYDCYYPIRIEEDALRSFDTSKKYVFWAGGPMASYPMQRFGDSFYVMIPPFKETFKEKAEFQILECLDIEYQQRFRFIETEDKFLTLYEKGKPVLVYNYGMIGHEGAPEQMTRSSYIHPLYGLDGEILSDDFPKDHYHHRGLYWAWPRIQVGEKEYDLWHLKGIEHRFEEWLHRESGPICALFGVRNGWYVGSKRVVEEKAEFAVFPEGKFGRAIDVRLRWKALDVPVTIIGQANLNKGYGGFNFRPAPRQDTKITTMGGFQEEDSNLNPFPWADFSARFGDREEMSGIAILVHKRNPGFPPGWCLRYYGFLGVAWPGLDTWTLKPDGPELELNFRVWIHRGDVEDGKVMQAFRAYLNPYEGLEIVKSKQKDEVKK